MTRPTYEEVDRVARRAATRYRVAFWADPADLLQEARVAALAARRTWDSSTGVPYDAYAWRACVFHLTRWCWKNTAPVTEADRKLRTLAGVHRVSVDDFADGAGPGWFHTAFTDPGPSPEDTLADEERRALIRQEVGAVLEPLGHRDSTRAAALLMGDPYAAGVGQPKAVRAVLGRARAMLRDDAALHRLWEEKEDLS